MNEIAPAAILAQSAALDMDSAVSVALLIAIIGGVAFISRALTQAQEQLKTISEALRDLKDLPRRVAVMERDVDQMKDSMRTLQGDINNLWADWRESGDANLSDIRRERGPRVRKDGTSQ